MRRTRLTWLVIGIVVGLLAAAVPSFMRASAGEGEMYLKLEGPNPDQAPREDGEETANRQPSVLEKIWACGGRDFTTTLPTHAIETYIPIKPENMKVADCAIKAASGTDISITIANSEH